MMASEDLDFTKRLRRVTIHLGTPDLPTLLAASLEAGNSHYITPRFATITVGESPHAKHFEATYDHNDQQTILRNLLVDVLWEVYREG